MHSKKASSHRPASPLVARTLQVVGIIVTLSTLFDIIILSLPYQLLEQDWQINFVTQLVDRGIVPLIGIVLILTGFWIDSSMEPLPERKTIWQDPRTWTLVLASFLGALFLVLFPLHLNNVRLAYQDSAQNISQEVVDTEQQLNSQIDSEIQSQRQQLELLVAATDEEIQQLVQQGRLTQEQAGLVSQFKDNPNAIDPFLQQRREELNTQAQTQLGIRREEVQQSLKTEALKSGLRVGVSSLLLSIGFIAIGWLGLRNLRHL